MYGVGFPYDIIFLNYVRFLMTGNIHNQIQKDEVVLWIKYKAIVDGRTTGL